MFPGLDLLKAQNGKPSASQETHYKPHTTKNNRLRDLSLLRIRPNPLGSLKKAPINHCHVPEAFV